MLSRSQSLVAVTEPRSRHVPPHVERVPRINHKACLEIDSCLVAATAVPSLLRFLGCVNDRLALLRLADQGPVDADNHELETILGGLGLGK